MAKIMAGSRSAAATSGDFPIARSFQVHAVTVLSKQPNILARRAISPFSRISMVEYFFLFFFFTRNQFSSISLYEVDDSQKSEQYSPSPEESCRFHPYSEVCCLVGRKRLPSGA